MTGEYITGKKLMERWNIEKYELMSLVRDGLKPWHPIHLQQYWIAPEDVKHIWIDGRGEHILDDISEIYPDLEDALFLLSDIATHPLDASVKKAPTVMNSEQNKHSTPVESMPTNFFTRKGNFWEVGYEGETGTVSNLGGIRCIVTLLESPGKSISCRELYLTVSRKAPERTISEDVASSEGLHIGSRKQSVSDYTAKGDYFRQWQELQDTIDNAEDGPEGEMVKKESKEEQDKLRPYLKKRNFSDPNDKKAQINIKKRLDIAYEKLREASMTGLEEHLKIHINPDDAYGRIYTGVIKWVITIK